LLDLIPIAKKIRLITKRNKARIENKIAIAKPIHKGHNTQTHDHVIILVIFKIENRTDKKTPNAKILIEQPCLLLSLILFFLPSLFVVFYLKIWGNGFETNVFFVIS